MYIHKGKYHTDLTLSYMQNLGMNEEQIESVLNQAEYERSKLEPQAKAARKEALKTVTLNGFVYDSDAKAIDSITKTISIADSQNTPESTTTTWWLADNTSRETTLAELRELLVLIDSKFKNVWQQFNDWQAGDKTEEFKVI